jgi:hypothetical protein
MKYMVKYKEQIEAYQWDGNEEETRSVLGELFNKVEKNKLYVNTIIFTPPIYYNEYEMYNNKDPFEDVIEILNIGDWVILTMNEYDQMPFKCTFKELCEKFYIII